MIAQFLRGKTYHSLIPQKKKNKPRGSQDTDTSRHTASTTGHPGHTRRHPLHSRVSRRSYQVPRRRSAGLPPADRLARHQECTKRRNFSSLLRTHISQQKKIETRRFVLRSLETDQLWRTHKRNLLQTRQPRQRHRCRNHSRPFPWPASKACLQPTTSSSGVAFRRFSS